MTYFVGLKKIRILLQSAKKWKMMSLSLAPASFVAKNREFYPFFQKCIDFSLRNCYGGSKWQ